MSQVPFILFGALFTVACCVATGKLLFQALSLIFYREEEYSFAFVAGAAGWSALVFALTAAGWAYGEVFLVAGLALMGLSAWRKAFRFSGQHLPPLDDPWKRIFPVVFSGFGVFYFVNALAPEISPDGSGYHLGLVVRYLRDHSFGPITTDMYANLSQGMEMLFLSAFAFGKHSAAALVHFAFLLVLPWMMVSYGRRFGFPAAGCWGALAFFVSPVVGVDGSAAYNDVAVAGILFALFYLLQIWDREPSNGLLVLIGVIAGFGCAAKYTAFTGVLFAVGFVAWRTIKTRRRVVPALAIVGLCSLAIMTPWLAKNVLVVDNPFSPFFNRYFPNPYVHVSFEETYRARMARYEGLESYWDVPWEAAVRGQVLQGLLGPGFLLAPVALLSLGSSAGRRLLLAAAVFGSPYVTNVGTRFLIPCLPALSLAMGLGFSRFPLIALPALLLHVAASIPAVIPAYAAPHVWRLSEFPWRAALRLQPEEEYLDSKLGTYAVARMIDEYVPAAGKVFAFTAPPQAYTKRDIVVAHHAASNNTLGEVLMTPIQENLQPTWSFRFEFSPRTIGGFRVLLADPAPPREWSITELHIFNEGTALTRDAAWRLQAEPNPWDVAYLFDGNPATRWKTWETPLPGMFAEVHFNAARQADAVLLDCSPDQGALQLRLEVMTESGHWEALPSEPVRSAAPPPSGIRKAAIQQLKTQGIDYLLLSEHDLGASDFAQNAEDWGISEVAEKKSYRLYRLH